MTSVRVAIRGVQRSGQRPAMAACARGNSLCAAPSPHPTAGSELAKLVALEQVRVGITEDKSKPTSFSHCAGLAHGQIRPIVDGMTEDHAILTDVVSTSPEEKHPVLASYASLPCPPFVHNERQLDVVTTLSRIYDATVSDWQSGEIRRAKPRRAPAPKAAPSKGLFGGLFSRKEEKKVATPKKVEAYTPPEYLAPKGAYIVGSSGSGKTSLLNVFFRSLPRDFPVVRLHWHEFCRDGFRYMHEATKTSRENKGPGCFELMADDITGRCRVFLLDEINITSISEGVLVKELFRQLWVRGVTVITTSNYKINELYYQGFNRSSLEDFFPELAERVPELDMSMDVDLRTVGIIDSGTFLVGLNEENKKKTHEKFLTAAGEGIQHDVELPVPLESRSIRIMAAAPSEGVARFTFQDLCKKPLGRSDYSLIATNFHTVFVDDIPQLTADDGVEFKRFVSLVDMMYDKKVSLHLLSAVPCSEIYTGGEKDLHLDDLFAWRRCRSMLTEMQSSKYETMVRLLREHLVSDKATHL